MRTNHNTGDTVSLLGYGCMRFPTIGMRDGTDNDTLDQEAINQSVDYALEHGVNYFDTSPAYCKGHSEAAIGELFRVIRATSILSRRNCRTSRLRHGPTRSL